jgi:osmotically-inducible protein OsmY
MMPKDMNVYDRSVRSMNDSDRYEFSGESEYSRERSDPYTMVDFMIDRGVDFRGYGPKGFYPSDLRIHEEVCELLTRDPRIDASEIDVSVSEGVVLLKGRVDSRQTKRLAEISIENLAGVRDIINQLSFLPLT